MQGIAIFVTILFQLQFFTHLLVVLKAKFEFFKYKWETLMHELGSTFVYDSNNTWVPYIQRKMEVLYR